METSTTSHGRNTFMDCLVRDIVRHYASLDSDDGDDHGDARSVADLTDVAAAIAALRTAEPPSTSDDDCCAICLHHHDSDEEEEEEEEETAAWKAIAACGHRFHGACVERWLRVKLTCPVCRCPAAVATLEEILEIYGDYSDSFQTTLRHVMAGNSGTPVVAT